VRKYVYHSRETAKIGFCTSLKSVNYFRFVPETIAFETTTFLSGMQNLVKIGKELRTLSFDNRSVDRHTHRQKPNWLYSLSNAFDRQSVWFLSVCVCVCVCVCSPIGCRTITSAILYRFLPNFACRSEMWLIQTLLFLEQTGSSLPILEMCEIQFWQFRYCGGHIFSRIVIKNWIEI